MDKDTFAALPLNKRCELLWEEGQFLASVQYYRFKANLYAMRSFFVEIFCFQGSTAIEKIEIASEDSLIKYLNKINVDNLIK